MYTVVEKIHLVFKYSFPCLFKKKNLVHNKSQQDSLG